MSNRPGKTHNKEIDVFEIEGVILKVTLRDLSKKRGVPRLHTHLLLDVEKTSPENLLSDFPSTVQEFRRRAILPHDRNLRIGQRVVLRVPLRKEEAIRTGRPWLIYDLYTVTE